MAYRGSGKRLAPGERVVLLRREWPAPVEREFRSALQMVQTPPADEGPIRARVHLEIGAGAGSTEYRLDVGSRVRFVGTSLIVHAEYLLADDAGTQPNLDVECWLGSGGAGGSERLTIYGDELSAAGLAASPFFVPGGGAALLPLGARYVRALWPTMAEYGVNEVRFQRSGTIVGCWRPTSPSDLIPVPADAYHVAVSPNPGTANEGRLIFEW